MIKYIYLSKFLYLFWFFLSLKSINNVVWKKIFRRCMDDGGIEKKYGYWLLV